MDEFAGLLVNAAVRAIAIVGGVVGIRDFPAFLPAMVDAEIAPEMLGIIAFKLRQRMPAMPDAPTDVATKPKADRPSAPTVIVSNAKGVQRLAITNALDDITSACKLNWVDIVGADAAAQCGVLQRLGLEPAEQSSLERFGQTGRLLVDQSKIRAVTWLADRPDGLTEVHLFGAERLIVTLWTGNPETLDAMRGHFAARASELERSCYKAAAIVLQLLLTTLHKAVSEIDFELDRTLRALDLGRGATDLPALQRRIRLLRSLWSNIDRYRSAVRLGVTGVESLPGIDPEGAAEFNDYAEQVEDVESRLYERSRWASEIAQDYANAVAQQQSEQISRLTIVATIFLPLTFMTGFFGMNFNWMIGWINGPAEFAVFGILLPVISAAFTVRWFKRRGLL